MQIKAVASLGASYVGVGGVPPGTLVDSYSESNQSNQQDLSSGNDRGAAQAFTVGIGAALGTCKFFLKKTSSPTGNAVATLYDMSGTFGFDAIPSGEALATSDNFDVSALTTSFALITFTFSGANQYVMSNEINYCIAIEFSGGDGGNNVNVGSDSSAPSHPGNASTKPLSEWFPSSSSLCFYVYTA